VGSTIPVTTFAGGTNWKQVACGRQCTQAIKTDGTLWTWGNSNNYGLLGISDSIQRSTPVTTFAGGTNWKQVTESSYDISMALNDDGVNKRLFVWGNGDEGRLGSHRSADFWIPVEVSSTVTWKQVSSGINHAAAVKTDGTLWLWGSAGAGSLGVSDSSQRDTPVTTFAGGTNWKQVSCGYITTAAIKTDGTLWIWGLNANGQLGNNNTLDVSTPITTFTGGTNWKQVSCGQRHISAIKTNGTLWIWGNSNYGQLGNSNTISRSTPVTTFTGGTNWKQVGSGPFYNAAIKTDGTLWVWGNNSNGQLGNSSAINRSTPVTTFTGGTNWKQVSAGQVLTAAVTSGISADLSLL
jgi:alpha-tubulin suppressor-like RCC1 family protein